MEQRRSPRRWLLAAAGLLIALALVANMVGWLPYPGGPLREAGSVGWLWTDGWPADWGSSSVGTTSATGLRAGDRIAVGDGLTSIGPWDATVERVTLLGATPGLELVDVLMARAGTTLHERPGLMLAPPEGWATTDPGLIALPTTLVAHPTPDEGTIVLELRAMEPGSYEFKDFEVSYRIGPFAFRTRYHLAVQLCIGPFVGDQGCAYDEAG